MDQRTVQPAARVAEAGDHQAEAPGAIAALGERLEAMFDALVSSPLPASLLTLVQTLEDVANDAQPQPEPRAFSRPAPPNP